MTEEKARTRSKRKHAKILLMKPIAIITGASRLAGIGAGITRELAAGGADVFTAYYRPYDHETGLAGAPDEARQILEEARGLGCRAEGLEIDLSDPSAPQRLFDAVESTLGPATILVNNATYSMRDGIENLTADLLDKTYMLNLRGMALLCAEFVRRYRRSQAQEGSYPVGRIINLSSGQGVGPMPGELAYVATKGAVEAFTTSLAAEVGRWGITANAVDPGITDTGWISPELMAEWRSNAPFGRVGKPADAARLIRFLASPEAGWVTGQVIHSRGGM